MALVKNNVWTLPNFCMKTVRVFLGGDDDGAQRRFLFKNYLKKNIHPLRKGGIFISNSCALASKMVCSFKNLAYFHKREQFNPVRF